MLERQGEVHAVHAHAADRDLGVERQAKAQVRGHTHAGQARPRQAERHVHARLGSAEDRTQEAVEGARAEHDREAFEVDRERQLEVAARLARVEREADARQLEPDSAGFSEEHARRVELDPERRAEPALG